MSLDTIRQKATEATLVAVNGHVDGIEALLTTIDSDTSKIPASPATEGKQDSTITELQNIDAGKLEETTFTGRVGEVQASPTAYTLLARLKSLEDKLDSLLTELTAKTEPADTQAVSGTVTANAGTNLNTSALALEATLQSVKTAVEIIDNFISGSKGLVTEDNSAAIKTAVEILDNCISGSEAQVDVVTQPALAATRDTIAAKLATDAIQNGTTALTPKFAKANVAASQTDSVLVAAVASKKIRVLGFLISSAGAATQITQSTFNTKPAGAGTAISANFATIGGQNTPCDFSPVGWFETNSGEGLTVTTGAGATQGFQILYVEV